MKFLSLLILDTSLSHRPFALKVEEEDQWDTDGVHSDTDVENIIEAQGFRSQKIDIEVSYEVGKGEEAPVEEIEVWADFDSEDDVGVGDVEYQEASQTTVCHEDHEAVEFWDDHCVPDGAQNYNIDCDEDSKGFSIADLVENHVP